MTTNELPPDVAVYLIEAALSVCLGKGLRDGATRDAVGAVIQSEAQAIVEGATRRQSELFEQLFALRPSEGVERLWEVLNTRIYHQALRCASYEEELMQYQNALEKQERVERLFS